MRRAIATLAILIGCVCAVRATAVGLGRQQSRQSQEQKQRSIPVDHLADEEKERKVRARELVLNQPDFTAELFFSRDEGRGAMAGPSAWRKKGASSGWKTDTEVYIGEAAKTTVRVDRRKGVYDKLARPRTGWAAGGVIDPVALARDPDLTFEALAR